MRKIATLALLGAALAAAWQHDGVTWAARHVGKQFQDQRRPVIIDSLCENLSSFQCTAHAEVVAAVDPAVRGYMYIGTDPDPRVAFELRRDPSWARANGN